MFLELLIITPAVLYLLHQLWVVVFQLPSGGPNPPPVPVRPWPRLGHLWMLRGNLFRTLKVWGDQTDGMFSLYMGRELNIVVTDFRLIKELMSKYSHHIVNTPPNVMQDILREGQDKGITGAKDDNWAEQRSVSQSILRSLVASKENTPRKIREQISVLIDQLTELETQGEPADLRLLVNICVGNIIFSVTIGETFDRKDPQCLEIIDHIQTINKKIIVFFLLLPLKLLQHLPGDPLNVRKFMNAFFCLSSVMRRYISRYSAELEEGYEADNFVASYLATARNLKTRGVESYLNEGNLVPLVRTLFVAGMESTGSIILWCLHYLSRQPDIQDRIHREIVQLVGTDRYPTISDRGQLPYLNAAIMEAQRMCSTVPMTLRREVSSSFRLGNYTIPKGAIVFPIIEAVHQDARIWGDPENFRPERFLDSSGVLTKPEELIPFGIGKRVCLGEALAQMEIFLCLASILQRFRFEPEDANLQLSSLTDSFALVRVPVKNRFKIFPRQ